MPPVLFFPLRLPQLKLPRLLTLPLDTGLHLSLIHIFGGGTLPPPGLDNKLIIKGDDTDEHENERPEADGAGNGSDR